MFWMLSPRFSDRSLLAGGISHVGKQENPTRRQSAHALAASRSPHGASLACRQNGFSLIELMIAVVIVGILAAVALPSYQNYVVKGNRAAAQAFMMDVENRQKQYLLDARSYAPDIATLGMTAPADVSGFYTVTITASATPPAFEIKATPVAGTRQEADGELILLSDGTKSPADKW